MGNMSISKPIGLVTMSAIYGSLDIQCTNNNITMAVINIRRERYK